jgi:hypothetical protein
MLSPMATLYVARSGTLSDWASDVGLSKMIFKVGVTEEVPEDLLLEKWCGQSDWEILAEVDAGGLTEEQVIENLSKKDKMIDPTYYPKIRGIRGIFKIVPNAVQNHIVIQRALAGDEVKTEPKLKPVDFATYLIANATR